MQRLDFNTLFVELFKIQDYLKTRGIEVVSHWGQGHCDDLIVFSCRRDFKMLQFRLTNFSWNLWQEFVLTDHSGNYHFRFDPVTKNPIRVEKLNLVQHIWNGVGTPSYELQEFAHEIHNILNELDQKLLKKNNEHLHELAKKSTQNL